MRNGCPELIFCKLLKFLTKLCIKHHFLRLMHFVNEEDFYLDESFGTGKDKRKRKSLQPKATGASLIHNLEKINEKVKICQKRED